MGLAAARLDLEGGVLEDIFWTEILVVFWGGLTVISKRLSEAARDNPNRASFAHYLPPLCAAITLPGIALLTVFIWVGFDEANETLLRLTYSFLALGLAGAYCSVIGVGRLPNKWRPLRWLMYLIAAVAAVEALEAIWLSDSLDYEKTLTQGFGDVLLVSVVALIAYFILAGIIYSILRETPKNQQIFVIMIYLVASLVGFTFGIIALIEDDDALGPGPFRLVLGSTLLLATLTPLQVVFHLWPESNGARLDSNVE